MCDPVSLTATAMAMTAATAVAGVAQKQQQADAQATQNQNIYNNAVSTMDANYNNVNLEQQQARTSAIQQQMQNDRNAEIATGKSVNTAGSMGVSGGSVADLLGSIAQQRDSYDTSVTSNYAAQEQVFNDQRTNVGNQEASTVNALTTPAMPNYALAGLQIADAGYKYYSPKSGDLPSLPQSGTSLGR